MGQYVADHMSTTNKFSGWYVALHYLAFPWVSGHALLWVGAHTISNARSVVRYEFRKLSLKEMINQSSDHLKEMFDKFDTSGDGFIDAKELVVALRVTTGEDLTLDESQKLINAADVDGDGVINFEEFKAICEGEHR